MKDPGSDRPSIVFALMNVSDPEEVGRFLYWLWHGELPGETPRSPLSVEELKKEWEADLTAHPWKATEMGWGPQAPRQRMARLLWQLLQDADEEEFHYRCTTRLNYLVEDAARCADVLPPIQEKLRWVLDGLAVVERETVATGQAAWGEPWYLPREEARYLRDQLRKAHPDLLQQESDYQEAIRFSLNYTITERCKALEPPSRDPRRIYVGEILENGRLGSYDFVWVEGEDCRHPLPNARTPYNQYVGNGLAWGYGGSGANALALSILTDATDGDLELAEQYRDNFLDEVVARFPQHEPMRISRADVMAWLHAHGVKVEHLAERRTLVEKRLAQYGPVIRHWANILGKKLCAQRFDLVPGDFECALYLDVVEMIQSGGQVLRCNRCELPIAHDGSSRSNRQRARWQKGKPVYHERCFQEVLRERKRVSWQRWAQDPAVREKRRLEASKRRKHPGDNKEARGA